MTYNDIKTQANLAGGYAWLSRLIIQFAEPDVDNPHGKFQGSSFSVHARVPDQFSLDENGNPKSRLVEYPFKEMNCISGHCESWDKIAEDLNLAAIDEVQRQAALLITKDEQIQTLESQVAMLTNQLNTAAVMILQNQPKDSND